MLSTTTLESEVTSDEGTASRSLHIGGRGALLKQLSMPGRLQSKAFQLQEENSIHMNRFHMRRKDKEILDGASLGNILKAAEYVTIAMCSDDEPYLVSLSHGYDEQRNCLYFHSAKEGKKLEILKANNRIWGQALLDHGYSEGNCTHLYASVHFSGKAYIVQDPCEQRHALETMIRQLDKDPETLIERMIPKDMSPAIVGRIDIDYMTGKKSAEVNV